jgi:hypothetical protein
VAVHGDEVRALLHGLAQHFRRLAADPPA